MRVLAIDPGTTQSGWALINGSTLSSGVMKNADMRFLLQDYGDILRPTDRVAIEMIASYGMPVGKEVFETCVWIGRFCEAWKGESEPALIYRRDVKLHLCGSVRAKDANIRAALLDKFGGNTVAKGTKQNPGPLYGVKSHAWSALAVAVTFAETTGDR